VRGSCCRSEGIEPPQLFVGQAQVGRRDVGTQVADAGRAGDRDDWDAVYLLAVVHPSQGDLPGRGAVDTGDLVQAGAQAARWLLVSGVLFVLAGALYLVRSRAGSSS